MNILSEVPIDLEKVKKEEINQEIMRTAMIAELDAINMYESMASLTEDRELAAILLDVAREEKIHVAMFQTVLMEVDAEYLKIMKDYSLK